jgi:hypothetical protein
MGGFSQNSTVIASAIPDRIDSVITSLILANVKVEWAATPNDHALSVTAYRVKFKTSLGIFVEDLSICMKADT